MTTDNNDGASLLKKELQELTAKIKALNESIDAQKKNGWISTGEAAYIKDRHRFNQLRQFQELNQRRDELEPEEQAELDKTIKELEGSLSPTGKALQEGLSEGLKGVFTSLLNGESTKHIWVSIRDSMLGQVKKMVADELASILTRGIFGSAMGVPDAADRKTMRDKGYQYGSTSKSGGGAGASGDSKKKDAQEGGTNQQLPDATNPLEGGLFSILDTLLLGLSNKLGQGFSFLTEKLSGLLGGLLGKLGGLFGGSGSGMGKAFSTFLGWLGRGIGARSGGHITGPGSATSDSIRAWLSNGEYVTRAAVVGQPGALAFLDDFNRHGMHALDAWSQRVRRAAGGPAGLPAPVSLAARLRARSLAEPRAWANQQPVIKQRLLPILDPDLLADAMRGPQGEQMLELHITRNPAKFRQLLGVS